MDIDLMRRLTAVHGIAGFEGPVRAAVARELATLVDEIRVDRLGNLIATRYGIGGPVVMLAAHMDEIGFLVRHVDDHGFARLQPVGSFDSRVLLAQRAVVHTRHGARLVGVIETTSEPLHFSTPQHAGSPALTDLFLDLGPAASGIEVGDMVTLDRDLYVTDDRLVGRALDDRLGLYVMVEALRLLTDSVSTVVAVATVQEEVGSRGAVVAGHAVDPDICVTIDLTVANDIPAARTEDEVTRLGRGPAIKVMDTTQLSDPGIVQHLRDLAAQYDVPVQLEVLNHGGTDASLVQRLRAGVTVVTLSIPARYIHTVNQTVAVRDVEHAVRLLGHYLADAHTRWSSTTHT